MKERFRLNLLLPDQTEEEKPKKIVLNPLPQSNFIFYFLIAVFGGLFVISLVANADPTIIGLFMVITIALTILLVLSKPEPLIEFREDGIHFLNPKKKSEQKFIPKEQIKAIDSEIETGEFGQDTVKHYYFLIYLKDGKKISVPLSSYFYDNNQQQKILRDLALYCTAIYTIPLQEEIVEEELHL